MFIAAGSHYVLRDGTLSVTVASDTIEASVAGGGTLALRTVEIRRGTEIDHLGASAFEPSADGRLRSAHRVAVEDLIPREGGIEQVWHFDREPSGDGDLEIVVAADRSTSVQQDEYGTIFGHGETALRYGNATWIDAAGRRTALATRWDRNQLAITVPADVLTTSQYPASLDPVVGPAALALESTYDARMLASGTAAAAWNGSEFLVVYQSRGDPAFSPEVFLDGHRVAADGTLFERPPRVIPGVVCGTPHLFWTGTHYDLFCGDFETIRLHRLTTSFSIDRTVVVATGAGAWSVARSDVGEYLVAWGPPSGSSVTDIRGTRVNAAGVALDTPPLAIATGPGRQFGPSVAWLGSSYYVAYTDDRYTTVPSDDIRGTPVSTAGVVASSDGVVLYDDPDEYETVRSLVAKPGGGALLTWNVIRSGGGSERTACRELAADGSFAWASEAVVLGAMNLYATSAWDGAAWMVVFSTLTNLFGASVSSPTSMTFIGSLATTTGTVDLLFPVLARSSASTLLVWNRGPVIWSASLGLGGIGPSTSLTYWGYESSLPQIATNGSGYIALVVDDNRFLSSDAYSIGLDLNGTPLQTSIFAIGVNGAVFFDGEAFPLGASSTGYLALRYERAGLRRVQLNALGETVSSYVAEEDFGPSRLEWNGTHYLGVGILAGIVFQRMDSTGAFVDATFSRFTTRGFPFPFSVAADDTTWMIAWPEETLGSTETDVVAARVAADGTRLDRDALVIGAGPGSQTRPVIAATGAGWIIGWVDTRPNPDGGGYVARVNRDGALIGVATRLPTGAMVVERVSVGTSVGAALVAWQESDGSVITRDDQQIRGLVMDTSTGALGTPFDLVVPPGRDVYEGAYLGRIASVGGQQFLMAYCEREPLSRRMRAHTKAVYVGSALGTPCATDAECAPNVCVDGVCCVSSCAGGSGDCRACSASAGARLDGLCEPLAATHVCRDSAGDCDIGEACDGTSTDCPPDSFRDALSICRDSIGPCDLAETCSGTSADCPSDSPAPAGTSCRDSAGPCDAPEACDGSASICPIDRARPDGTSCDDGLACNGVRACAAGVCGPATAPTCDDGDRCTEDGCDEPSGCVSEPIAGCCEDDGDCDDANLCTIDRCDASSCTHDDIPGCEFDGGTDAGSADGGVIGDAAQPRSDGAVPDAARDGGLGAASEPGGCGCGASPQGGTIAWAIALIITLTFRRRTTLVLEPRASTTSILVAVVLHLWFGASACGDDGGAPDASSPDSGVSALDGGLDASSPDAGIAELEAEIHRAFAEAWCEMHTNCFPWSTSLFEGSIQYRNTRGSCVDVILSYLGLARRHALLVASAVANGAAVYDREGARACLDAIVARCDQSNVFSGVFRELDDPICADVVAGLRGLGESCGPYSCRPGYRCSATLFSCGTCVPQTPALGDSCREDTECPHASPQGFARCAAVSIDAPLDRRCREVRLVEGRGLGEACGQVEVDGDVVTIAVCERGLWCERANNLPYATTGACRAPTPIGAPCMSSRERCAGDSACIDSVCTPIRIETEIGAPCDRTAGVACDELNDLACVDGSCVVFGDGSEGSTCRGHTDCSEQLYCPTAIPPAEPTCAPRSAPGDPCTEPDQCAIDCLPEGVCAEPCP